MATLIRVTGDWSLAEDAVQGAFEKAAVHWPIDGIPRNAGAWLTTVARNAALDVLRRRASEDRKMREAGRMLEGDEHSVGVDPAVLAARGWDEEADDRLRLVVTCAHPALAMEARVALTLHTVAGLTTREIAHAFLVSEATMGQRLVRAKRRISGAGIPYRVPPLDELPERIDGVLAVLSLVFSEGYAASAGEEWIRVDLAAEAIRLVRLLLDVVPAEAADEARALLALMLLQHARRGARLDDAGDLVPLEEQDRTRWDASALAEARDILGVPHRVRGGYRVQAELAAEHALRSGTPDWNRIVALYDELGAHTASPAVALNRAIAVGFARGFSEGLAELDVLDASGVLAGYHLLPAARADLLRRRGDRMAALAAYHEALSLAPTETERRFLRRRIGELGGETDSP